MSANDKKSRGTHGVSKEDSDLFRQAVAGTNVNKINHHLQNIAEKFTAKPTIKIRKKSPAIDNSANIAGVTTGVMIHKTNQGAYVEFARSGLQRKVLRKLKRGDYHCTETLDLHGKTTNDAKNALTQFLNQTHAGGNSAALIIHGKGLHSGGFGGVLKQFTLDWLEQQPAVKAYCSALPKDGGTGAVYVLLRAGK